ILSQTQLATTQRDHRIDGQLTRTLHPRSASAVEPAHVDAELVELGEIAPQMCVTSLTADCHDGRMLAHKQTTEPIVALNHVVPKLLLQPQGRFKIDRAEQKNLQRFGG